MSAPPRRAVLYIESADGRLIPVKAVVASDGSSATLSLVIESDLVGLAKESTLAGVKAQTDKLTFDASGRLLVANPPALNVNLDTRASESTLQSVKSTVESLVADSTGLPSAFKNFYLKVSTVTIPSSDVWFIPSSMVYAFKTLTVEGYLRVEGSVKVKDILDVKGILDLENGVVDVGWP